MKRIAFLCLLAMPLLLGLKPTANPIRIGVASPLSNGGMNNIARSIVHGVTLAADEWNAKGGVLGRNIELVVQDDQSNPKFAAVVANTLIEEGVVGVIGHVNSDTSLAAIEHYNHAGIPMISPSSTNTELTAKGYTGVFRVCGKDSQQAEVAADFATKLKLKKVAFVHDRTEYGKGLIDEFTQHIQGKLESVYASDFDSDNPDFADMLQAITAKKPDLIYFCGDYTSAGNFLRQARELGIHAVFIGGDEAADSGFIAIAGKKVKDVYFTANPDIKQQPLARDFVAKYEQKFGTVGGYSAYAYDATNVLFTAIEKAGTTAGKQVIEKLHSLKFDGVLGEIKFDANGDVQAAPYVIWTVKNGKLVEYK